MSEAEAVYKNSLEDRECSRSSVAVPARASASGPAAIVHLRWARIVARPHRYWAELISPHVLGFFNLHGAWAVKSVLASELLFSQHKTWSS